MDRPDPSPAEESASSKTFRQLARGGRRYALPWLSIGRWRRRMLLVGAALLAGFICIAFAIGADLAIHAHQQLMALTPLLTLLVAPAGFALMAWLCRSYFPGSQGSGIPQAIAASISDDPKARGKLLSTRIAFGKVFLTLGALLSGATVGREGPSVQVGASILHTLAGKRFGRIAPTRDLIIAGGAAGIAAAFNTPLGGIMFAIEELSRHRPFIANSTTLIAVIFAGLISLATLGNYTYFGITQAAIGWPEGIWPVILCGAAGGIGGGLFSRLLLATTRSLPGKLGIFAREHPIRLAAACGLGTAIIGLATGGLTYGTGYTESKAALEGIAELPFYYGIAKAATVLLAFLSGIPGGVFAPALAVGAGIGSNIASFMPVEHGAALLALGMVAFLSGMTQSPITSFVLVMEMTANHQFLLPLMAASVIAHAFSKSVAPIPLYDAIAYGMIRKLHPHQPIPAQPTDDERLEAELAAQAKLAEQAKQAAEQAAQQARQAAENNIDSPGAQGQASQP